MCKLYREMNSVKKHQGTYQEGGERRSAPGDLGVVQRFINSRDIEAGTDQLSDPKSASQWLLVNGLTSEPQAVETVEDLSAVVNLREALRDMLAARHDSTEVEEASRVVLSETARGGQLSITVDSFGTMLTVATATGLSGALADIVLRVHRAQTEDGWNRLKVCLNDGCRWAFWDSSRNRSGRWCDMSLCGNQAKVAAFRDRH